MNVTKWTTNQAHIAFNYREVTFNSQPDGATIYLGSTSLGSTPITMKELQPSVVSLK